MNAPRSALPFSAGAVSRPSAEPLLVGESPALQQLIQMVDRVAPTRHALLVTGPTGSGKEVVARRIHARSETPDEPFVDVNCGAIPENLVEAELFGHVRGAFTGASETRAGVFQQVGRGTLFLDEIGELPLAMQPKLLRVLETGSFRPIGASASLRFEGRVVAATHRDLRDAAHAGGFREDLYYRLAVFVLAVPGLDQRGEDIPALVKHFAAQQRRAIDFTPAAMQRLRRHAWPGHVRQLRNLVSRLSVLAPETQVDVDVLDPFLATETVGGEWREQLADRLLLLDGDDKLAAAEYLLIDRALQRTHNNKSAAAALLGVSRKTVERRLKARADRDDEARRLLARAEAHVRAAQFREAVPLLRRCLDSLLKSGEEADARRLRFEANLALAVSLRSVHGWLYPEATAAYAAALAAGDGVCDPGELASVQFGIWTTQLTTLQLSDARATAQDLLQRAQRIDAPARLDEAHVAMTNTLFWLGDSSESLACLARGNLLGIGLDDRRVGAQGLDLAGLALTFEGLACYQTGADDRARHAMTVLIARSGLPNEHALSHVLNLQGAVWLACLFDDVERLGDLAAELVSVAETAGLAFYQGVGEVFRACWLGAHGPIDEAERLLLDGYNRMIGHGGALFYSFTAWHHGELLLRAGRYRDCEQVLRAALDTVLERQERVYLGELLIVRARALHALGELGQAEQELRSAISTAEALGSVPARIAAATYLADLLAGIGRLADGIQMLERALRGTPPLQAGPVAQRAVAKLAELRHSHSLLS
ncbi:sigma 54-interacting transcriptional regulator [Paraburkholderia caballeronis]|uniref:sigma 54-interacting transcriptional regulator n=1 Tax=Paraburkholderia caballeronis TaxID=416943 RepID=UPI00106469C2|nr:sigma 54-interacting transcriptional regulator [Paraburkholderia caballeronis]TDV19703.1 regulatory Fis family protein [Paraburkholderia caballeronis]TDV22302.1 regulatory Fis family protein [Paraburkholderia caballeronis]TDV29206.1 regulatory Fis family protein [Paraburkholderia caballeronis]TDV39155.1 regulatory Fis family protein [Paraburkholderia caballeronis]